jgi:tetratricopeptide (TPR) repeat protein
MYKFIKELRRREVFRTGGLYVGIAWILIEASSVLLPTFDVSDWVFKAIVIAAFLGFPVALILAWFYDVTDQGILREDQKEGPAGSLIGGRLTDLIVIGVLAIALIISVSLNMIDRSEVEVELAPVSVLIADFDNQTGDPLFDGSLEQALNIGLESASFVTAFKRSAAEQLLETLRPGGKLDEEGARLVSIREGVKLVIVGTVKGGDDGYELSARMVSPEDGVVIAESSVDAKDKIGVLAAVSSLADSIREELGDKSINDADRPVGETFTAASLEAVKAYTTAQNLAVASKYEESLPYYESAVKEDPDFGRALSGWALSLFMLGRENEATARWEEALSKMDTMTQRERYRTLGLYYVNVTGNFEKGVETYQALVDRFPSDSVGYSNLAVAYFYTLDFKKALEAGKRALELYPANKIMLSNYALYAMYAGDFTAAAKHGQELLKLDAEYAMAWLPVAIAALSENELSVARDAYESMAATGNVDGDSLAILGLADLELYSGNFATAAEQLETSAAVMQKRGNKRLMATNRILLAEANYILGNPKGVQPLLQQAIDLAPGIGRDVPAALLSIATGDKKAAQNIAESLAQKLQPQARAYSQLIKGVLALDAGRYVDAVDALRGGVEFADLWLVRFYLGRAYLEAEFFAEALDEFSICQERRGEASAIFLDDLPSWRYSAELTYWQGRAQEKLGMTAAAAESFSYFLILRADRGPLAKDAMERINNNLR